MSAILRHISRSSRSNYLCSRILTQTSGSFRNMCNARSPNNDTIAGTMNDVKREISRKLGIEQTYSPLMHSREHLLQYEPKLNDELPPRSMQDSFTTALIPLGTDKQLRDKYVTFLGTVRLGRLMEDMDLFAVWVVMQHIKVPNLDQNVPFPYTFVTVLVDKISFTDLIPKPDLDIRLSGHVSWVGKSSVEVVVWMEQKVHDRWRKLTRALFLMASRNATNTKSAIVNQVIPANEEEKIILDGGETRKKRRLVTQSIFTQEPSNLEQKIIHDIFVKTIDLENQTLNHHILPPGAVWMEDSVLSNIIFSHPEDRNAHNTVFGGFLMRNALELSFALAFQFSKHHPKLEHISDIRFQKPVHVSSFIKMHAHLIYTEMNYMEIVVMAAVNDAAGGHNTTNIFYYTYSNEGKLPQVIPKTYHEAIWYLNGRRHFIDAMGLTGGGNDPPLRGIKNPIMQ